MPRTHSYSLERQGYFGLHVLVVATHFSVDLQSDGPVGCMVVCAIPESE
jgi:hypothetical protein